jgi:hypothetical protein
LLLRVYGEKDKAAFKAYDNNGGFADFDSFEAVTPEVRAAAVSCVFTAVVATNGYRLGTHQSPRFATVQVDANGDRVKFTAPSVEMALAVWNDHAAGIDEWLQETLRPIAASGVRVRVYGSPSNESLTNVVDAENAYAEFDEINAIPSELREGFVYTVASAAPCNTYQPGKYPVRYEPSALIPCLYLNGSEGGEKCCSSELIDATVEATGSHILVRSTNLQFAYEAWGMYLRALAPGSQHAHEAHLAFVRLCDNAAKA